MVKKIAVLRANALGDYIFIIPALQALKEAYPEAELTLLGKQWHKDFLTDRAGPVNRVVVVPPYPGVGEKENFNADIAEVNTFFSEMQKEEFDMAFQLHGGGKNSNPFLLRLGAKLNAGLKTPDAVDLDINVPYVYYFSEILRYLEVVSKVGATTTSIEPVVTVLQSDINEATNVLTNHNKPIAVIHPGATDVRRRWPAENFSQIADFLTNEGFQVCITGVSAEKEIVSGVITNARNSEKIQDLCGKLTLNGMTGLLSLAEVVISNDTGPLHLARAVKTPTAGIFLCGNGITGLPMTTAYNRTLMSWTVNCPLCGLSSKQFDKEDRGFCTHETSFVTDVTVQEVKLTVAELISNSKKQNKVLRDSFSETVQRF
ncbi:glycosyltransferase family 9 protein [Rubrolithibacter danxiaensis]|uniref:glycosyltransferase family 9 protein n=1 Tax=Rubrolithibacter danxiaensis TaxID=3390805 RepID=UPI003BF8F9DB